MSAYTKDPGGSLIQFSTIPNHPGRAQREVPQSAPIARPTESPLAQEAAASEQDLDHALAQLEGPIRMMRSLREKIGILERRREELETIVVRERAVFRDQLGRAKKVISETGGALAKTKEESDRVTKANEEARSHLQQAAARLEAATSEITRLRQELSSANGRMNQTVVNFKARYAQDTGKLQQTIEQIKGHHAVELASFKQACTDLRTRAMSAEAAFKHVQAREGALKVEATAALNKLKQREQQIKKMALSSHLWASELERLRRENEGLSARTAVIPAIEQERERWRTIAEGEREQRRIEGERQAALERDLRARIAESERELGARQAEFERLLASRVSEAENALRASHAQDLARLEAEARLLREDLERMRREEEQARSERGRAQAEFLEACAELERAKVGQEQAKADLSKARADLEARSEQVRSLRFEGPIRELLVAKERELGRVLEASRDLGAADPARARADQVIGVLVRQVEVLKGALAANAAPDAPKRIVTPPPFPPALLAAREIKPPPLPADYVAVITSDPISE